MKSIGVTLLTINMIILPKGTSNLRFDTLESLEIGTIQNLA